MSTTNRPDLGTHAVVSRVEVDVSMRSDEFIEDPLASYAVLRGECPVAWSRPDNQWMITSYDNAKTVFQDHQHFSNEAYRRPGQPPLLVLAQDPPIHSHYRRLLTAFFAPTITEALLPKLEAYSDELFDRFIESGSADLILQYGNPLPALLVLEQCGLPTDEWTKFAEPNHAVQYERPGTPGFERALAGMRWIAGELYAAAAARRADPRDDLTSHLATATVNGDLVPLEDVAGILMTIIGGGVDTTTSLYANALRYLHANHEARDRLIADPGLIPSACEEFLRHFAPAQAMSREVRGDSVVGAQVLADGDRVSVCVASANRDPDAFPDPDAMVLDRFPNRHASFGLGIHRCLGSHVARAMIQLMLRHTLERAPDFVIDEAGARPYGSPIVNGWITMPATFTPGRKRATSSTLSI